MQEVNCEHNAHSVSSFDPDALTASSNTAHQPACLLEHSPFRVMKHTDAHPAVALL